MAKKYYQNVSGMTAGSISAMFNDELEMYDVTHVKTTPRLFTAKLCQAFVNDLYTMYDMGVDECEEELNDERTCLIEDWLESKTLLNRPDIAEALREGRSC
jgi:hypothetical protein